MEVERTPLLVPFNDIEYGGIFTIKKDLSSIYMKVVLNNGDVTMVNIENGCENVVNYLSELEVIPVKAKVCC